MRCLLDTHVAFWLVFEPNKLSAAVTEILQEPKNEVLVSTISFWEIAIKYRLGKFPQFNTNLGDFISVLDKAGYTLLPAKTEHFEAYFNYPHFSEEHKDPFDRLLLVTADAENVTFITKDEKFNLYKDRIKIMW